MNDAVIPGACKGIFVDPAEPVDRIGMTPVPGAIKYPLK